MSTAQTLKNGKKFELPDLSKFPRIAIDVETYDPTLKELGPGVRRTGYLIGIAVAVDSGESWYVPLRHQAGFNFDLDQAHAWAMNELTRPNQPKVAANIMYDLDFLYQWGIIVTAPFYDVQVAEPLLDEQRDSYSLQALSQFYLGEGKEETGIQAWAQEHLKKNQDPKGHLYLMPSELVQEYARKDAALVLKILDLQLPKLKDQNLMALFMLESKLTEVLLAMRRRGVRVDTKRLAEVEAYVLQQTIQNQTKLNELAGFEVNVNAATSLKLLCDQLGVQTITTEKGAVSFPQWWLAEQAVNHQVLELALEVRKLVKTDGTFLKGTIYDHLVQGRIHTSFNQLRSDFFGTVTGRLSSSNPNLQFLPARDPKVGQMVRGLFLPDEGDQWVMCDYSSVEPRISLHYAEDTTAEEIKQALRKNPSMDIYAPMMARLPQYTRAQIKNVFLGLSYGMGKAKLAKQLKLSLAEAREIIGSFNQMVPFLSDLSKRAMYVAESRGYVRTILNRRRRFPNTRFAYKAFNAIIQGGSADIMKLAMVKMFESGLFGEIGAPLLTIHDELDFSVPSSKLHLVHELKHQMEQAIELTVPLHVKPEIGTTWGEAKYHET